uniref:Protein WUSCHEL-like n=1 Tax=Tanacetum cinerariifolium TaxID=118510 RepID=A0A6L2KKX7_TANCI|nr:protein WUSCHEL-like [Tanacetum cinerariifolium]
MKILKNKLESLKLLENNIESMKILKNKLESLKLQENQPADGLVPLSIKNHIRKCFAEAVKETTSRDPQGHAKALYGTINTIIIVDLLVVVMIRVFDLLVVVRIISAFMVKTNFLEGIFGESIWREYMTGVSRPQICHQIIAWENHREEEDQEGNNSPEIKTLPLFPIHGGSQHDFFVLEASDLSSDHSVGGYYTARMVGPYMDITTDFVCVIYVN